jgi:hypothetical protein
MNWHPWKFQALLRLEQGKPLFAAPPRTCQRVARQRFLAELYDEFIIEAGPDGPRLTDTGREICANWRRRHGLEPTPLKYDERQQRVILAAAGQGCNATLAERFGTSREAINAFKYRLKRRIAAQRSGGQGNTPQSPQG